MSDNFFPQIDKVVARAAISQATADTQDIVAAVSGKRIRVLALVLVAAGAVVATIKSSSTALTGAMTLAAGVPVKAGPATALGAEEIITAAGEALKLTLGGAVQVSGWILYYTE